LLILYKNFLLKCGFPSRYFSGSLAVFKERGEAETLTYPKVWCLLDDVRTFFEQNPDAD